MPTAVEIAVRTSGTSAAVRSIAQVEGQSSKLGRALKTVVVGGAVAAGAALVKFGVDSVKAASDSQQSIGATRTVFEKYAGAVIRESKRAATQVGLSANEYRELANVTGASLSGAGIPLRKTADLTQDLTKRAADMAATFGGTTREAIEAVGSALRGETDPIERYGVSVKEADVTARLAAKGQDELTGAAAKQASMMARLELIMSKTAKTEGAFARESDTLAGAKQRLDARVENLQAKFGKLLLPVLTEGVDLISRKVIPAANDLADWLKRNQDEISGFAGAVKDGLLPPLQTLADVARDVAGFVSDLPPEIQSIGVQAALAALVLPRLTGAIDKATTSTGGFITNLRQSQTRMQALAGAARQAAGVAGLLALVKSADESNDALKALETTAGSTLVGAALAKGPGAVIGLLVGVGKSTDDYIKKQREANDALGTWESHLNHLKDGTLPDYAATLDQATGAVTRLTREQVINAARANGILSIANKLDVSTRDLVGSVLGQTAATRRLNRATEENFGRLSALENVKLEAWLQDNTRAFALQAHQTAENARGVEGWRKALRGLPPKVQTAVKQLGADASAAELRQLKRQYDLTPKQVRTIIEAVGTDVTIRKVKGVWQVFEDGEKVRPGLDAWQSELASALADGKRTTDRGVRDLNQLLSGGTSKARANLGPFQASLNAGIDSARNSASSGGSSIGNALSSGLTGAINTAVSTVAAAARRMVAAALGAGRDEAKAKSPSRETWRLGTDMGDGLAGGLRASRGKAANEGSKLVDAVLKASAQSARDLRDELRELLEKHKLKGDALRRAMNSLEDETKALNRNAAAQDRVNARLQKAREHLQDLRQQARDYAKSIRDAVVESGNITNLGKDENGTATTTGILDQLKAKLRDAQRFASLIKQLTAAGLNQTSIAQLLAAGVEGGLSTAEALAAGGPAAVAEINQLTQQLEQAGAGLGNAAADTMYEAGIEAAEGLVKGLEARAKELDRIADRLAKRLVDAIRKALKGKTKDAGKNAGKGLAIGLEDTHARTSGQRLARDLVEGFGVPDLGTRVTAHAVFAAMTSEDAAGPTIIRVKLSAEQRSQLERGREIQIDLDAYNGSGGRKKA